MNSRTKISYMRRFATVSISLIIIAITLYVPAAIADDTISARYQQPRGSHIKWVVNIPEQLPAAVIIIQYIRPGSEILHSSHPMSSYDQEKGVAKWLLTPTSSGPMKMSIRVSKPILKKGQIRGDVIFKDESDNMTTSIFRETRTKKKAYEGC